MWEGWRSGFMLRKAALLAVIAGALALQGCPSDEPLEAQFRATPTAGGAPLTVTFEDLSNSTEGPIVSWVWFFGDGQTSNISSPVHIYEAAGTYTVTLRVSNGTRAAEETKQSFITVGQGSQGPNADFEAVPRIANAPVAVRFTDLSTSGSLPITFRNWNFGDGATSSDEDPVHLYTRPGAYTVTLSVGNALGTDTQTRTSYVVVNREEDE